MDSSSRNFSEIQVLNTAEAAEFSLRALALRDSWRQRNETGLYYTIGAVTQEDGQDQMDTYYGIADVFNPLLREHFGDLLEKICLALENEKNEPVRLHDRFGLPGIMIYRSPGKPAIVVGEQPHIDLQYLKLPWPEEFKPIDDNLLSFTLSLALPLEGAGLRTWPQYRAGRSGLVRLTAMNAEFIPYVTGTMLCHDGKTPHHGVAMRTNGHGDDIRITVQGFGARVKGEWLLYW